MNFNIKKSFSEPFMVDDNSSIFINNRTEPRRESWLPQTPGLRSELKFSFLCDDHRKFLMVSIWVCPATHKPHLGLPLHSICIFKRAQLIKWRHPWSFQLFLWFIQVNGSKWLVLVRLSHYLQWFTPLFPCSELQTCKAAFGTTILQLGLCTCCPLGPFKLFFISCSPVSWINH